MASSGNPPWMPEFFEGDRIDHQDNTGRFGMKNLPKRLEIFLPKRRRRNVLFPIEVNPVIQDFSI